MLKDQNFMRIALEVAKGSKCVSKQVGALIVKDTRILSTGYNGTPAGYVNCNDYWSGEYTEEHHDWSAKYEIHAEMNALLWAARRGVSIEGGTVYCTHEPCFQCTKNMLAAGIERIVYYHEYQHTDSNEARAFIEDSGKKIEKINLN